MTLKELATEIARREGKKSHVKIGDIREIIRHLRDIIAEKEEAGFLAFAKILQKKKKKQKLKAGTVRTK